ncbi:MAG: ribonuclease HII [Bacteroidales bacterium]|nr:ribonuclease HII [Bacteroidales bacterium]
MLQSSLTPDLTEAGCDEAGRGCLAGPVFAAAVILPKDYKNVILNDSKKLSESIRFKLRDIIQKDALAWAVASLDNHYIDRKNILNASIAAMHEAVKKLSLQPQLLLIDGNRFKPYEDIPYQCLVKGDARFMSIAAASILAKTYRDEYMVEIGTEYPEFEWHKNKGYPTAKHIEILEKRGHTPYHRLTFKVNKQMKLNFD